MSLACDYCGEKLEIAFIGVNNGRLEKRCMICMLEGLPIEMTASSEPQAEIAELQRLYGDGPQ